VDNVVSMDVLLGNMGKSMNIIYGGRCISIAMFD
jgi:hypothetical protein